MYIREAHPKDSNWALGHDVDDPTTFEERVGVAKQCTSALELSIPCVVDDLKDTVNQLYNGWPERLYVIGTDKRIVYKGGVGPFGFKPAEVEAVLQGGAKLGDAKPETPSTTPKKLPVFILLGQSNMVGFGRIEAKTDRGTLAYYCEEEGKYPHLRDEDGTWKLRDDVWCVKTTTGQKQGPLAPGFGARANFFGPELQFGHVIGDLYEEPVLLIKASQGNRSLGWDILPPGTPRFEHGGRVYAGSGDKAPSWVEGQPKQEVNWYAGKQYDDFVRDIHEVLDNLPKFYPAAKDREVEIAGFAWWQGHKDQNAAHASRYEFNLVNLIKNLRKEFQAPAAPFAIATIAFGGDKLQGPGLEVLEAQLAVSGERGKYPEFAGNVKSIDARGFWRARDISPSGQDYHYHHNAETYIEVGNALGQAMAEMLRRKAKTPKTPR